MKLIVLGNFVVTVGNLRTRYMDPYFKSHFATVYDPTAKYSVSKTKHCPCSLGQMDNCHRLTNRTNYSFLGATFQLFTDVLQLPKWTFYHSYLTRKLAPNIKCLTMTKVLQGSLQKSFYEIP